ncbi:MAG: glutathione S-transferase family protein [Pseudomonadales bacterium]
MISLYTLPGAFGLRNPSPFCLKIEMALAYLKLDFDIVCEANPQKAPKGKMPWLVIDEGPDGGEKIIPDSELILDYLDKKTNGGLFGYLSEQEIATGLSFTRLAEDHLYWLMVAARWLDDDWFKVVKKGFFGFIPAPLGFIISTVARRKMRQTYNLHGLGRHSSEEQAEFARKDLQAIASQVRSHNYIAGDRLTVYDFGVASMVAGLIDNQPATWISKIADEMPELRQYSEGIQQEMNIYCRELDAPAQA